MEEQLNPLAATLLLQHTLRSLCIHEKSQWVYAVFWRILPRNYPPPKWDLQGGAFDRSRGNRRNWILVWEDGFCNFTASCRGTATSSSAAYGDYDYHNTKGLKPELFFKMSHEIYNYGEGLIGKVASDHSHKWVFKEPHDNEINFLSAWNNPADSQPRTWEAQFQSGIKTIALIAVREGVVQLGSLNKVMEDLSFVVVLQQRFDYLESIPGVLLPHPSSSALAVKPEGSELAESWPYNGGGAPPMEFHNHFSNQVGIMPSMSSLEALLSKLPSVGPAPLGGYCEAPSMLASTQRATPSELMGMERMVKKEMEEEYGQDRGLDLGGNGESSSSMSSYYTTSMGVIESSRGF